MPWFRSTPPMRAPTAYQFQDALGSVTLATNAAGEVTEKYRYTAYGVTLYAGANTAAFRFTGRRLQPVLPPPTATTRLAGDCSRASMAH